MQCVSIEHYSGGGAKINLQAVYGRGEGNEDFADATPSGMCTMSIAPGRAAIDMFKPGETYDLFFSPVVKKPVSDPA